MKIRLGIDIGGTKTNIGLFTDDGELLKSEKMPTKGMEPLFEKIKEMCNQYEIVSIGVGVPGTVDIVNGVVEFAPNLGWKNYALKALFQEHFDVPIYLGQDTEAAALGEYLFGAGIGFSNIVCITVGTGIGCGLVIDNKLYKGKYRTAGEFGHTISVLNGRECNCGKKGCLEAYASGTGILKEYKSRTNANPEILCTEDIFAGAKNGDMLCKQVIEKAVEYLGIAIVNLSNAIAPEAVIISGGISAEKELFINPLLDFVKEHVYSLQKDKLIIRIAALLENAPMYGAAFLYKER